MDLFLEGALQRVDEEIARAFLCTLFVAKGVEQVGDILLFYHKAHEEILVWQLFFVGVGYETIEHIVVLHSRVRTDGLKATVVIGKYQTIGRDNHA